MDVNAQYHNFQWHAITNNQPTPYIILNILEVDPNVNPKPLNSMSLGKSAQQHNMGKVCSGLYKCTGHVMSYLGLLRLASQ